MAFNFGSLFGDRDLENMLGRIDNLTTTLSTQKSPEMQAKDNTSAALKEFMASLKEDESQSTPSGLNQLLQTLTVPAQRTNRYMIYDEIYSSVQIIKSIVRVYINNTLQRDIVTGKSIIYIDSPEFKTDSSQIGKYKKFIQSVIDHFDIEKKLKDRMLPDLFRYGDHFVEIIDLKSDVVDMPTAKNSEHSVTNLKSSMVVSDNRLITESLDYINRRLKQNGSEQSKDIAFESVIDSFVDLVFEIDNSPKPTDIDIYETQPLFENTDPKKDSKKIKIDGFMPTHLNRFVLRFHNPKSLVVLTTAHNNNIIGYVEVKESKKMDISPGVGMQFASMIKQISAISKDKTEDHSAVTRKIVKRVIEKIVSKLDVVKQTGTNKTKQEINAEYENQLYSKLGEDLFYIVKKLYIESDPEKDLQLPKVAVRFISTDRMVHLCLNPNEYSPYGTSIIDSLIYPGKLYLLTQLTNIVTKLSRSALIRKWYVETGPREHHTNLMQKLKRELRNQRITVDDIVSFKSLPRILSDFKDMILFTKKGAKFVDVDVQSFGD